MEKEYSSKWKSSVQPRKQRKYRYNAPAHVLGKFMKAPLSKELRKKHQMRNLRVRKGDKVKVLRGQFRGTEAKVERVDMKNVKLYIEKVEVQKKDGSKAMYPINPSNVLITEIAEDKRRLKGEKK